MLKADYLKEVFPPSHLNESLNLLEIQNKTDEEANEVIEARSNFIKECELDNGKVFLKGEKYIQELYDNARMLIEEARRVCKIIETQEHHQIQNHLRKLQDRGTIEL